MSTDTQHKGRPDLYPLKLVTPQQSRVIWGSFQKEAFWVCLRLTESEPLKAGSKSCILTHIFKISIFKKATLNSHPFMGMYSIHMGPERKCKC